MVDPNDGVRIPAHYGETHLCAAMLMHAAHSGKNDLLQDALRLFDGITVHWEKDRHTASYHNDFNNFALALIHRQLTKINEGARVDKAKKLLLESPDSKNHTVNWLPMRAYVDLTRYEMTGNEKYISDAVALLTQVGEAMYEDGMFDDLMPNQEINNQRCSTFNHRYSPSFRGFCSHYTTGYSFRQ